MSRTPWLRPRGRPCRLRRCFTSAPTPSQLRPHGRPLHRSGASNSAAICAEVTASWALHALARGCAHERRPEPRSRWQGPVRSIVQAPSAAIFARAPSRARAPCRAHARTTACGKAAAHGRRSHAAAPRSQVPSGRKRRSTCARIGRHGMVAASGKAATTAHERQRGDRGRSHGARLVPTSQLERGRAPYAHACKHALAAVSPAAPLPSGHPSPGTPFF